MQRDLAHLFDMLHEAEMARSFVRGKNYEDFEADIQCRYAVIRAIEIIGEAAARVSREFRETHRNLPWKQMIGARNRLIHGYDDIVLSTVWEIVDKHLPKLISDLTPLIPPQQD